MIDISSQSILPYICGLWGLLPLKSRMYSNVFAFLAFACCAFVYSAVIYTFMLLLSWSLKHLKHIKHMFNMRTRFSLLYSRRRTSEENSNYLATPKPRRGKQQCPSSHLGMCWQVLELCKRVFPKA